MEFLIGAAVGWFIGRQMAMQQMMQPGAMVAPGVSLPVAGGVNLNVTAGPTVQPVTGGVGWSGCPSGQMAAQDPTTGRVYCVPVSY